MAEQHGQDAAVRQAEITPVEVIRPLGRSEIVLVCEHASCHIPEAFGALGLTPDRARSHIAWDPGAGDMADALSERLDAVLVRGTVSRLIYDCNRPPDAPDAIRDSGDGAAIPGNANLSAAERSERIENYYRPFQTILADTLANRLDLSPILVTLHSFTPIFDGQSRDVQIGILHDSDPRLANAVLEVAQNRDGHHFDIRRNAPYGPEDGVTHTLREHGLANGLLNVMIEIRSDLLTTPQQCGAMAARLQIWLTEALSALSAAPARTRLA